MPWFHDRGDQQNANMVGLKNHHRAITTHLNSPVTKASIQLLMSNYDYIVSLYWVRLFQQSNFRHMAASQSYVEYVITRISQ